MIFQNIHYRCEFVQRKANLCDIFPLCYIRGYDSYPVFSHSQREGTCTGKMATDNLKQLFLDFENISPNCTVASAAACPVVIKFCDAIADGKSFSEFHLLSFLKSVTIN